MKNQIKQNILIIENIIELKHLQKNHENDFNHFQEYKKTNNYFQLQLSELKKIKERIIFKNELDFSMYIKNFFAIYFRIETFKAFYLDTRVINSKDIYRKTLEFLGGAV